MPKKRIYCPYCSENITTKEEDGIPREYCASCNQFFYNNPLPVASSIVVNDRRVLLVKRKNQPHKGAWCLPMGFAETGETAEEAALRELEEETGVKGKIIDFILIDSSRNDMYGDLLFLTFEVEQTGGKLGAGDDAEEVRYYPLDKLPELPFHSNLKAIDAYVRAKSDYWAIMDSFTLSSKMHQFEIKGGDFLSNKLLHIIDSNAEVIGNRWLRDVRTNASTPTYKKFNPQTSFSRNKMVLAQFSKWLGGHYSSKELKDFYTQLGADRKTEGFALSEVISALSLTRRHIWEFALAHHMWNKTIDIYMTLELERRMMLFFDKAAYNITRGYEMQKPKAKS